MNEGNISVRN